MLNFTTLIHVSVLCVFCIQLENFEKTLFRYFSKYIMIAKHILLSIWHQWRGQLYMSLFAFHTMNCRCDYWHHTRDLLQSVRTKNESKNKKKNNCFYDKNFRILYNIPWVFVYVSIYNGRKHIAVHASIDLLDRCVVSHSLCCCR